MCEVSTLELVVGILSTQSRITVEEEYGTDNRGVSRRFSVVGSPASVHRRALVALEASISRSMLPNGAVVTAIEEQELSGQYFSLSLHGANILITAKPDYSPGSRVRNRTELSITKTASSADG